MGNLDYIGATPGSTDEIPQTPSTLEEYLSGGGIFENFYKQYNRLPTYDEYVKLGGDKNQNGFTREISAQYSTLSSLGVDTLKMGTTETSPTWMDQITNMDQQGTVANDFYNIFKQAGETQYQQGTKNLEIAQRDLGVNQAVDRQKFLDGIKNRRRVALKSGLSSAQIANQEVQSLMMAQNQSNANAQSYYDQRMQLNNNFALNDSNARMSAYEAMGPNAFGGTLGTIGGAGDANQATLNYMKNSGAKDYYSAYDKNTNG